MEIVSSAVIFDEEFSEYAKNSSLDYLNKLLKFSEKKFGNFLTDRIELLKTAVSDYLISKCADEDVYDYLDSIIKAKANQTLENIGDYYQNMLPHEAIDNFINGNFNELIIKAESYCNDLCAKIREKVKIIKTINDIEMANYKVYNFCINNVDNLFSASAKNVGFYDSMEYSAFDITDLTGLSHFIDDLLLEAKIISKFDRDVRIYISKEINCYETDEMIVRNNNICRAMLMNYSLLALYSNTPEQVIMPDSMLNIILLEINNGMITEKDISDALINGTIKFSDEEMAYIRKNFVAKLFGENSVLDKKCLINIIR